MNVSEDEMERAVRILRAGGLVAFPTETVYGLGADALNEQAVARIFEAKGRPATNPLIAHVADAGIARRYVRDWPEEAERLARRFWPGPLTIVLRKKESGPGRIADNATAGLETVGVRAPDHPVALELLRRFDGPVAAPSANRSNRVSPTTAKHVRDELGEAVDLILDGGPCRVGIESTVLDLTRDRPVILRPGAVRREEIEEEIGKVDVFGGVVGGKESAASPGQQAVHYSPRARTYRFEVGRKDIVTRRIEQEKGAVAVMTLGGEGEWGRARVIVMPPDAREYARALYRTLRELDEAGMETIFIEMPPEGVEWVAVRDRLMRATLEIRFSIIR